MKPLQRSSTQQQTSSGPANDWAASPHQTGWKATVPDTLVKGQCTHQVPTASQLDLVQTEDQMRLLKRSTLPIVLGIVPEWCNKGVSCLLLFTEAMDGMIYERWRRLIQTGGIKPCLYSQGDWVIDYCYFTGHNSAAVYPPFHFNLPQRSIMVREERVTGRSW